MLTKYLSHLNYRLYVVQRLFNIIMSCSNSSAYQDKKIKSPLPRNPHLSNFPSPMALIPGQMPYVCRGNLKFRIDQCMDFIWKQVKKYALDRVPIKNGNRQSWWNIRLKLAHVIFYDIEWGLCLWLQQAGDQEIPSLNHLKSACFNLKIM